MKRAVLAIALFSCHPQPVSDTKLYADDAIWCVPVTVEFQGELRSGTICSDGSDLCAAVRQAVVDYGSYAGIRSYGTCH